MSDLERWERFSPSSVGSFRHCPRSWYFDVVEGRPKGEATEAMVRGTFVHRVIELLMQRPPQSRTLVAAKECAVIAWSEMDDEILAVFGPCDSDALEVQIREFRWLSWWSIERFFELAEPAKMDVWATEFDLDVELGGVPFVGQIDLVENRSLGLRVHDHKTSELPEKGKPWTAEREREKLGQPRLYAAALREMGYIVRKVGLFFLSPEGNSGELSERVDDDALDATVTGLQLTWAASRRVIESGDPPANTGPLCGWCDFIGSCGEGQREVRVRLGRGKNIGPAAEKLGFL